MNLEDHLGDIIRKGRTAAGLSPAALAQTAGVSEADLAAMEESGLVAKGIDWKKLAEPLKLSPTKLQQIAEGWVPQQPDLNQWPGFRMFTTEQENMAVHSYLVWDDVGREAAMFDTGWKADEAFRCIEENDLQLRHLFITHTHEDHIAALGDIRARFPKIRLHSQSKHAPPDQRNRANDFIHLGSLRITNRDTPGHAEDGVTYIIGTWPEDAPHVAIVGDAIFSGSIGSGKQSWDLARQKVRDQILSLPGDTLICPGHGPLTTVQQEKDHNPFF